MKQSILYLFLACGLFALPLQLHAQLLDDVGSANLLTLQCAGSSDSGSGDYEAYGKKLAKTLSFLSSEKQQRVFGYLPNPLASLSLPNINLAVSDAVATAGSAVPSGETSNPLLDAIAKLNEAMFGGGETPAPIIGGVDPTATEPSTPLTEPAPPAAPTTLDEGLDGLTSWLANGGQDFTKEEMAAKIDGVIDAGLLDPQGKNGTEILDALTSFGGKFNPSKGNKGLGGGPETAPGLNKLEGMLDWAIKSKK